jgi:hypothetical protein
MRQTALFLFALLPALAVGQGGPVADRVVYRGKDGKPVTAAGEVKESAAGVQLLVGGKVRETLSPADVVRIDPTELPGLSKLDLQKAQALEDGRDPAKAAAEFADLAKKAGTNEKAKRYAQFREAVWAAKVADGKPADEFAAAAKVAAAKLEAVARAGKKGWECWPAARTAARLHGELGDFPKAAAVFAELAAAELPKELRAEARLDEAAAHMRAKAKDKATAALGKLDKELPAGLAERVPVLRAAVAGDVAKLQAAVDAAKEPATKAVGYNLLADALLAAGKPRDALWALLWVDAVYNQDADERVLAVRKLADQFAAQGDADRAEQFRGRLREVR